MHQQILQTLGNIDIYLLDQVMKNRYTPGERILDAGAGGGRNLPWFAGQDFQLYAVDQDEEAIEMLRLQYPGWSATQLQVAALENLPFQNNFFDHILCSAVLHFAQTTKHFKAMMAEMIRVLCPGGSLFIRMTSDIGIEDKAVLAGNGVYDLPDESRRFLLTRNLLDQILSQYPVGLLEPLKTVNVADIRCMSTLVLEKNPFVDPSFPSVNFTW